MERMREQITVIADELQTLRTEVIGVKSSHAAMHQTSVDNNARHVERLASIEDKVAKLGQGVTGGIGIGKGRALMESKQVTVSKFAGAVSDTRSKFLTWAESMRDKVELYEGDMVDAMEKVARMDTPVTREVSQSWA